MESLLNEDTLIHSLPPNWESLAEAFPSIRGQEQRVIFTYYPHIYMPREIPIPADLAVHENIHLHQQQLVTPGIWWQEYIINPEFRLSQELEAYGAQLHYWSAYRNLIFKQMHHNLAVDLSSDFYRNIISYSEASSQLKKIVNELGPLPKLIDQEAKNREAKNKKDNEAGH